MNLQTPQDWQELTRLTHGEPCTIERIKLQKSGIAIEGEFELPQLARLAMEDQVFITAFVRTHGSIKEMEQVFGVSYPTIKARLTRIAEKLEFVETNPPATTSSRAEILARLQHGELTAAQAVQELEKLK